MKKIYLVASKRGSLLISDSIPNNALEVDSIELVRTAHDKWQNYEYVREDVYTNISDTSFEFFASFIFSETYIRHTFIDRSEIETFVFDSEFGAVRLFKRLTGASNVSSALSDLAFELVDALDDMNSKRSSDSVNIDLPESKSC